MKNINFIKTASIADQKAISRWWFFSCALCVFCIALMACAHGFQLYHWYALSHECQTFQSTLQSMSAQMQTYEQLCVQQKKLQQKKSKCDRVMAGMSCVRDFLISVRTATKDAVLQSCKWDKHTVELLLEVPTVLAATQRFTDIQKLKGLESAQLVSVHSSRNNKLLATIRSKK